MVRRDDPKPSVGRPSEGTGSSCIVPAGENPVRVSIGARGSRPAPEAERPTGEARCRKPPAAQAANGKQVRGPQHQVKPAASSEEQSESRAEHVAVKAMSAADDSGSAAADLGGVWGAARGQGAMRNTRGPSAPPVERQGAPDKPMAKRGVVQRESEGAVVVTILAQKNAGGAKGPCFSHAEQAGTCEGMVRTAGPNNPGGLRVAVKSKAQEPGARLRDRAKPPVHARRGGLSVSRMREIRTYGLNGGPALYSLTFNS
jgi:hypothetical protein